MPVSLKGFRRRVGAFIGGFATAIPLADSAIDTVVMTWTLCSIADPLVALREMRRVFWINLLLSLAHKRSQFWDC